MASSDHVTCNNNNNNNNNTQKPSSKQLTFPQLLARYRDLADGKLIVKFHDVIVSMPDAQPSTLATYRCSLNVMQSALAALPCRAQYASLGEAFLRPVTVKGGSLLTAALPDHNRRSKVLSVICCLCQLFPGIPDPGEGDHTQILAHLPAGVRCCLQGPTQSNGWGGSISKLPDLAEVDRGIASLPLGDRTRLAVMLYTDLKWCDTRDNDPLAILNLGAVKVFLPGDPPPNQADMMREAADYLRHIGGDAQPENADHAAAGWLVLDPKGATASTCWKAWTMGGMDLALTTMHCHLACQKSCDATTCQGAKAHGGCLPIWHIVMWPDPSRTCLTLAAQAFLSQSMIALCGQSLGPRYITSEAPCLHSSFNNRSKRMQIN